MNTSCQRLALLARAARRIRLTKRLMPSPGRRLLRSARSILQTHCSQDQYRLSVLSRLQRNKRPRLRLLKPSRKARKRKMKRMRTAAPPPEMSSSGCRCSKNQRGEAFVKCWIILLLCLCKVVSPGSRFQWSSSRRRNRCLQQWCQQRQLLQKQRRRRSQSHSSRELHLCNHSRLQPRRQEDRHRQWSRRRYRPPLPQIPRLLQRH
mmetsp:Transcript_18902/g.43937  ORF Transcript_18902/g.43937 Transcript_18902/m.43937 type:complete len:206 (-) Transcript_18902:1388-2005(-)